MSGSVGKRSAVMTSGRHHAGRLGLARAPARATRSNKTSRNRRNGVIGRSSRTATRTRRVTARLTVPLEHPVHGRATLSPAGLLACGSRSCPPSRIEIQWPDGQSLAAHSCGYSRRFTLAGDTAFPVRLRLRRTDDGYINSELNRGVKILPQSDRAASAAAVGRCESPGHDAARRRRRLNRSSRQRPPACRRPMRDRRTAS